MGELDGDDQLHADAQRDRMLDRELARDLGRPERASAIAGPAVMRRLADRPALGEA